MSNYRALKGLHSKAQPQEKPRTLVFFPGEVNPSKDYAHSARNGEVAIDVPPEIAFGHVYLADGFGRPTEQGVLAAGGPDLATPLADRGHTMERTPPGTYVLGPKHHHTSNSWPASFVPFGAEVRQTPDGEYEVSADGGKRWTLATGDKGVVTQVLRTMYLNEGQELSNESIHKSMLQDARALFLDDDGKSIDRYTGNDFGEWSWQLYQKDGHGRLHATPYFIHTTPDDEALHRVGISPAPVNSHGCIHLTIDGRDQLMSSGYLQEGSTLIVKPYGEKGPLARQYMDIYDANKNAGNSHWYFDDVARESMVLPDSVNRITDPTHGTGGPRNSSSASPIASSSASSVGGPTQVSQSTPRTPSTSL
jgi:hypothetical protein